MTFVTRMLELFAKEFSVLQGAPSSPLRRARPLMKNASGGPSAQVSGRVLRGSGSVIEGPGWRLRVRDSEGSSDHDEEQTENDHDEEQTESDHPSSSDE